jgi:hypothetical protein
MTRKAVVSQLRQHEKYERLVAATADLQPLATAIAHPCDESSLRGALEAAEAGIIVPVLVGPKEKIRSLAKSLDLDIEGIDIVEAPHSQAAAEKAVELIRSGKAELLMKGSLHSDELLGAVTKRETGLRTARRISHVFVMDVPTHPQTLFITDAAVNIAPDLLAKRDIIQNAIDLYAALGYPDFDTMLEVVVGKVGVVIRGRLHNLVGLLHVSATVWVDEPPPQIVVAVGVECEQAFAWGVMLTQTATELERNVFLYLFGLVHPEKTEVVVLKLFRLVQRETMNTTAVPHLEVEVRLIVELDTWLRDSMPSTFLVVPVQEHVPRGGTKLGTGLTRDDGVSARVLDEAGERLHASRSSFAVAPPTTEASILSCRTVKSTLLRVGDVGDRDFHYVAHHKIRTAMAGKRKTHPMATATMVSPLDM